MTFKLHIRKAARLGAGLLLAGAAAFGTAHAAGAEPKEPKEVDWSFGGMFGTFDQDALQRGYQVYRTVCSGCHSMDYVAFRNLGQKGGPFYLDKCPEGVADNVDCSNPNDNPIVRQIASEFQIEDGPDDFGEMYMREGVPSDYFPSPYPNEQIARLANNGAQPPDLSLIVKAREHGSNYVYSLLSGYVDPPPSVEIPFGQYYNPWFPGDMAQLLKAEDLDEEGHAEKGVEVPAGGVLAMAPPLVDGIVDYADEETPETVEQYAKDVVTFLTWAAEPKLEERKKLGVMTLGYLLILCGLLYFSYREIWSKVKH